ncbi:hypothetical protein Tsubulata_030726 [Turnera subulata]|uniref:Extradiol ring-cleavage dioxygenase class III enzyme subunit B domain-containing protein n=1 Tax=Turnera subulata TaxID=218843 RepID=A0A9Q0JFB2_9ROSI|nr:hypothetical protein Tsubulata_030726 [Turnera subulata]
MDTFYISHGSPTLCIDEKIPARQFLKSWEGEVLKKEMRPSAILVVSGHWDTQHPAVNVVERNDTIYDFYGFPKAMYELKYNPPGAPGLARRVKQLLLDSPEGLVETVREDRKRGLDHGAWVPLMLMYPEGDIPVCQLSVQSGKDAEYHYRIGKALSPLREEGVLIMGSGSATHNLRAIYPSATTVAPWASQFDTWLRDSLLQGRYQDVIQYESKAPHAKQAHPSPDHFYPLHVAMGAAAAHNSKAQLIHHSWGLGTISYASYRFTTTHTQSH